MGNMQSNLYRSSTLANLDMDLIVQLGDLRIRRITGKILLLLYCATIFIAAVIPPSTAVCIERANLGPLVYIY